MAQDHNEKGLKIKTDLNRKKTIQVLKPNSITLASSELAPNMFGPSSELAPNMFGASSELASVIEFGL